MKCGAIPRTGRFVSLNRTDGSRSDSLELTCAAGPADAFNGQIQYTSPARQRFGRTELVSGERLRPVGEWARADFDRRHRLLVLGSLTPGAADLGVGLTVQSGPPYSETLGTDPFNNGRGGARPAGVSRNSLQGAASADLDLRASRDFPLGAAPSQRTLTVSLDAFNALNRVNYVRYVGTVSSPLFAQPVSASAPRALQLSARLEF